MILTVWNWWCYWMETQTINKVGKCIYNYFNRWWDNETLTMLVVPCFSDKFENTAFHVHLFFQRVVITIPVVSHWKWVFKTISAISTYCYIFTLYFYVLSPETHTAISILFALFLWGSRRLSDFLRFKHPVKSRNKTETWTLSTSGCVFAPCLAPLMEMQLHYIVFLQIYCHCFILLTLPRYLWKRHTLSHSICAWKRNLESLSSYWKSNSELGQTWQKMISWLLVGSFLVCSSLSLARKQLFI